MTPPSRGLRVLMTTDAVGGVWVFATALARELCRRGDKVTLITLGPPPQEHQLAAIRNIAGLTVEITDLALEWMDPEGHDLARATDRLRDLERRLKPDLVHLNSYREASAGFAAPVLLSAHSCVRSWWRACRGGDPSEERWHTYIADISAGLARADAWAAPTRAFRDTVQALYAPPTLGEVIHNGTEFAPPPCVKERFILAAGRLWDEAKNLSALTAVAPDVAWPVRVAGPLQSFDGASAAGGALEHVEVLGELPRPDMLAHMRRAAIFISPAVYEPFGLTVLEAAAAGCALVLSDIPYFRELWADAALMVDPLNNRAIRQALQSLCRDSVLRATLQQAATRRARGYSLAITVENYRALYAAMLGTAPMRRTVSTTRSAEARP